MGLFAGPWALSRPGDKLRWWYWWLRGRGKWCAKTVHTTCNCVDSLLMLAL